MVAIVSQYNHPLLQRAHHCRKESVTLIELSLSRKNESRYQTKYSISQFLITHRICAIPTRSQYKFVETNYNTNGKQASGSQCG